MPWLRNWQAKAAKMYFYIVICTSLLGPPRSAARFRSFHDECDDPWEDPKVSLLSLCILFASSSTSTSCHHELTTLARPLQLIHSNQLAHTAHHPCFFNPCTNLIVSLKLSLNRLLHRSLFSLFLFNPGRS